MEAFFAPLLVVSGAKLYFLEAVVPFALVYFRHRYALKTWLFSINYCFNVPAWRRLCHCWGVMEARGLETTSSLQEVTVSSTSCSFIEGSWKLSEQRFVSNEPHAV